MQEIMEGEQNNSRKNKKHKKQSSIFMYPVTQHEWQVGQQVHINTGYLCNQVLKYSHMMGERKDASEKAKEVKPSLPLVGQKK